MFLRIILEINYVSYFFVNSKHKQFQFLDLDKKSFKKLWNADSVKFSPAKSIDAGGAAWAQKQKQTIFDMLKS